MKSRATTTLRVPVKWDVENASSPEALISILTRFKSVRVFGGLSNTLLIGKGRAVIYRGGELPDRLLETPIPASVPLQKLLSALAKTGLSGLEGLAGIPGTLGGAFAKDCRANETHFRSVVERIEIWKEGKIREVKKNEWKGEPILSVYLRKDFFNRENPEKCRERLFVFWSEKRKKQPLDLPSLGCVFKNPGEVPAWKLIRECQLHHTILGGFAVSGLHANFIVNLWGKDPKDYVKLAEKIKGAVWKRKGVILAYDVEIIEGEMESEKG